MKKFLRYILYLLIIIISFYIFRIAIVKEMIYLIFISFAAAYTLKPLQESITKRGLSKKVSAVILILGLVLILLISFTVLLPSLFSESNDFNASFSEIRKFSDYIYNKLKWIRSNDFTSKIYIDLSNRLNLFLIGLAKKFINGLVALGEDFLSILVMPILTYYFLADDVEIGKFLIGIFPTDRRTLIKKVIKDIDKVLKRYIVSQFILSILVGIVTFFILLFYKVRFPLILSMLNALFNLIPYFGPLFGAIPSVFMGVLKSPITGIWVAVWFNIVQQIEGNLISPKVTGDSVSMHPLTVIILLIIGGKIAGFWGMVVAIPFGVIVKIIIEDLNIYLY